MTDAHPTLKQLTDHLHGVLSAAEADWVGAHLEACDECAEVMARLAAEADLFTELAAGDAQLTSDAVREAIFDRTTRATTSASAPARGRRSTRKAHRKVLQLRRAGSPVPLVVAVGALAAAAVIVVMLGSGPREPGRDVRTANGRAVQPAPADVPEWSPFDDAEEPATKDAPDEPPREELAVAPAVDKVEDAPEPAPSVAPTPPRPAVAAVESAPQEPPPPAEPAPGPAPYAQAPAHVATIEGTVEVRHASTEGWHTAYVGGWVGEGDTVRAKYGRASLTLTSGSVVYVNRFTTFTLSKRAGPPGLALVGGEVYIETSKADSGLYVDSPHGRATDIGTRFDVTAKKTGTTVLVVEGEVRASTDNGDANVATDHEVLLVRRTSPPGFVRRASNAKKRVAWATSVKPKVDIRVASMGLVALYEFGDGGGTIVHDSSGVGQPLDLHIQRAAGATWHRGSLDVRASSVIASATPATKITSACRKTNEFTIEAWVRPHQEKLPGPGRIAALSVDPGVNNFVLGQGSGHPHQPATANYVLRVTAKEKWHTLDAPEGTPPNRVVHLVAMRSRDGAVSIYVNGERVASGRTAGTFSTWKNTAKLAIANEPAPDNLGERPWLGEYYLVAVYSKALSPEDVKKLFDAGQPR